MQYNTEHTLMIILLFCRVCVEQFTTTTDIYEDYKDISEGQLRILSTFARTTAQGWVGVRRWVCNIYMGRSRVLANIIG